MSAAGIITAPHPGFVGGQAGMEEGSDPRGGEFRHLHPKQQPFTSALRRYMIFQV
jgi:hypothetical protein